MSRSVVVSAVRTPFGKLGGGLKHRAATELGAVVIRAAVERIGLEGTEVDYVIMGQVLQAGAGQAPARQASIGAGLPIEVGSDTINKVCASSIRAVEMADQMIRAGDHHVVVAEADERHRILQEALHVRAGEMVRRHPAQPPGAGAGCGTT